MRPDDAAEIMEGWPARDSPLWTGELRWLLDRSTALLRADLGATSGCHPARRCRATGASPGGTSTCTGTWRWSTSSGVPPRPRHPRHRVLDDLADLGRNLAIDRQMRVRAGRSCRAG
ncbi:hypothetical protein NKG94_08055 [Micromonospora sp. M12]